MELRRVETPRCISHGCAEQLWATDRSQVPALTGRGTDTAAFSPDTLCGSFSLTLHYSPVSLCAVNKTSSTHPSLLSTELQAAHGPTCDKAQASGGQTGACARTPTGRSHSCWVTGGPSTDVALPPGSIQGAGMPLPRGLSDCTLGMVGSKTSSVTNSHQSSRSQGQESCRRHRSRAEPRGVLD